MCAPGARLITRRPMPEPAREGLAAAGTPFDHVAVDGPHEPIDRRPIATRELGVMKAVASWMARKGFSANGISVAGMIFGLLAGVSLFFTPRIPEAARLLWVGGAVFTASMPSSKAIRRKCRCRAIACRSSSAPPAG